MKVKASSLMLLVSAAILMVLFVGTWCWHLSVHHTPEEVIQHGLLAVQNHDWPAVQRCAIKLKNDSKHRGEQQLFQGIYRLKMGSPSAALKEFQHMEPVGAIREPALLYTGEALYRLDRILEAEFLFATLATEHPDNCDAHRWLAGIAHDLGDMNRALEEIKILIHLNPADFRPHCLQAQIYVDLENYRGAVEAYSQAEALQPPESVLAEILPEMARSQIQIREYAAAEKTLARAPRSSIVSALEAECRLNLGDESGARLQLQDVLEYDPEQTYALRLLGRLELDSGHADAAIEPLQQVVELDRSDHESRHQLAQALRLTGRVSEANAADQMASRTIEINQQLTNLLRDSIGKPQDAEIRDQMAQLCDELGKPKMAAMWRKAALVCRQRFTVQSSLLEKGQLPSAP